MQIWYDEFEPNPLTNRPFKTTRDRDWMKNNAAFNSKIDNRISCFSLYQEAKKIEAGISITKIESCEFDNLYVEFYTSSNDTLWLGIGDDINVININGSCFQNSLEMMQYLYSTSMLETIDTSKFNKK